MSTEMNWEDLLKEIIKSNDEKERKKYAKKLSKLIVSTLNGSDSFTSSTKKEESHVEEPKVTKEVVVTEKKKDKKKNKKTSEDSNEHIENGKGNSKELTISNKDVDKEIEQKSSKKRKSKEIAETVDEEPVKSNAKKSKNEEEEIGEEPESIAKSFKTEKATGSTEKKRFQRVNEKEALEKALITDNSYDALFGGEGYGAKANEKLKTVRGKDFRHEKTKKKRGSYRGGPINDDIIRSVNFDSDEE